MAATYILGPLRLDAETDTLFRGGEPISLGHRALALLRVLVEQRGIPVSKDALMDVAWAGLTVEESTSQRRSEPYVGCLGTPSVRGQCLSLMRHGSPSYCLYIFASLRLSMRLTRVRALPIFSLRTPRWAIPCRSGLQLR